MSHQLTSLGTLAFSRTSTSSVQFCSPADIFSKVKIVMRCRNLHSISFPSHILGHILYITWCSSPVRVLICFTAAVGSNKQKNTNTKTSSLLLHCESSNRATALKEQSNTLLHSLSSVYQHTLLSPGTEIHNEEHCGKSLRATQRKERREMERSMNEKQEVFIRLEKS